MLHILLGYELLGQRGNAEALYVGPLKSEVDRIRSEDTTHGSFMICSGINGIRKSNLNFNPNAKAEAEAKAQAEAEAKAQAEAEAKAQAEAEAKAQAEAEAAAAAAEQPTLTAPAPTARTSRK